MRSAQFLSNIREDRERTSVYRNPLFTGYVGWKKGVGSFYTMQMLSSTYHIMT